MNQVPSEPGGTAAGPRVHPLARTLLILLVALAATLAGAIVARQWMERDAAAPTTQAAAVFREARPLPPFQLIAHDGSAFGPERLQGHWSLLFFGFTNCPDVCPATLAQLSAVRKALADLDAKRQPAVVMVSVDPQRDTPEQLARYVPYFDPSFLGVTGTRESIDALTKGMGVAVHVGPERDGTYTVDHTAALFLVDPAGKLAAVFPTPHDTRVIAADYRRIVGEERG